jgi:parallel beta-helix repeat protein
LNNPYGIYLSSSNGNNITNNTVSSNNDYGIFLQNSNNSRIYHNNFIANPNQAYDDGDNQWDNGYPSGGNYWSDFDEPSEGAYDDYQGGDQDLLGGDGIVDNGSVVGGGKNPYIIYDENQDDYPLIEPWGLDETPPIIYLISPSNNSIAYFSF